MPPMIKHPSELANAGFELYCSFSHQDLLHFIKPYMDKKNLYTHVYKASLFLCFLIFFGGLGYLIGSGSFEWQMVQYLMMGLGMVLLLIPVHEVIHGIVYKLVGAPKVQYGVVWKQAVFYALAHHFVIGFAAFRLVALAPFVIISLSLIVAIFLSSGYWFITFFAMLLLHTLFSGGDFALLSFFKEHQHLEMLTYDDKETGETFFFSKSG
jgi:hypothetical protein